MSSRCRIASCASLAAAAFLLAACAWIGGTHTSTMTCPKIMAAPGADTIAIFGPTGHELKDVVVGGKIDAISAQCAPGKDMIVMNAAIRFEAERISNAITEASFPYFVALVDPSRKVLTENQFSVSFKFLPAEPARHVPTENITVNLPVKDQATGSDYTVFVGFQLTPDQLALNRQTHAQ
jgi:hypothetical protein